MLRLVYSWNYGWKACGDGGNPICEPRLPGRWRCSWARRWHSYALSQSGTDKRPCTREVDIMKVEVEIVESLVNPPWFDCLCILQLFYFYCHLVCTRERREDLLPDRLMIWNFGLKQTVSVLLRKLRYSNELGERNIWLENGETNHRKVNCPAGATRTIPDKPKYNQKYTPPDWSKWIHTPSPRLN